MVETVFEPWLGLAGGALIGLSAGLLMLISGKIAGVSSILNGLVAQPAKAELEWRIVFLLGLVIGAAWIGLLLPATREMMFGSGVIPLALGGVLVGFGTRLGQGCTSGHGVCGLARLSLRSLVATLVFMGVAILTVFVTRHIGGL